MGYVEEDQTRDKPAAGTESNDSIAGSPEHPVPFGEYLLMGKIAQGGMAEVFRARALEDRQHLLAIKCMRASLSTESRFVDMFIREGKLAMLLEYPGIVRTFDVGSVDGRFFIAMEHLSGKDLNHILRRCQETGRRVPVPHALFIAAKICRALHFAHTLNTPAGRPLNIVNRDVSPSNVRIMYDGQVKMLDFGIAQAVLQATSEIGVLKGKFSYMSPEQVRGLPLDRRTDIFSVGIVLHEMLACARLFRDESEFVLMEMVRRAQIEPPSAFNTRVPPELDRAVMRALSREAGARYQDAESMAEGLERILESYQFTTEELGEFVRSLFPADFKHDEGLVQSCLSDSDPEPRETRPRSKRRRRKQRRREQTRALEPPRRNTRVWIMAVCVLLAAVVILVVALR